jgi:hypothetical protein
MAASSRAYCAAIVGSGGGGATHHPAPSLPLLDRRCANDEYLPSRSLGTSSSRWSTSSSSSSPSPSSSSGGASPIRRWDDAWAWERLGRDDDDFGIVDEGNVEDIQRRCGHRSDRRVVVAAKDDDAGDRTGRVVAIAIAVAASVIPRGRHRRDRSPPDDGSLAEGARRVGAAPSGSPSRR